jgi:lipopolysaccharide export system protein LptC
VNSRLYDRLAAIVSMLLLSALAAGSYYLAEISRRLADVPSRGALRLEPDYFVEGVVFTRVNAQGLPAFRLSAERMLHYPHDERTEYRHPELISLDPEKPVMRLTGTMGTSSADGVETHLTGDVVLTREAKGATPAMTVLTDHVVIYSDTEIARTDRPVRILRGASILTGTGMEFDNSTRSLTVDSQVRGTWQPEPAPR